MQKYEIGRPKEKKKKKKRGKRKEERKKEKERKTQALRNDKMSALEREGRAKREKRQSHPDPDMFCQIWP
jgi:hypothetical protein